MKFRIWPRSLAWRTALALLVALAVVQAAGLTIHALDRVDLQRLEQRRTLALRVMQVYRSVALLPREDRAERLRELDWPEDLRAEMAAGPPLPDDTWRPVPPPMQRAIRVDMLLVPLPPRLRPHELHVLFDPEQARLEIGMELPDSDWLLVHAQTHPPRPWHSPNFLMAFLGMTIAAALLILWAVRRLTAPVRVLAEAAEALGRDVNAPPLPERGPSEVATAAIAFNTMASRIRRFVQDRTFLLTALGHDLRTPITRLKLRAEFVEDDEMRQKMLADLDELEAMVSATLTFGREVADTEKPRPLDLPALVRTVLDEAGDANPEAADRLTYAGPEHLTVQARPVAFKRALANIIGNALAYAGSASVTLHPAAGGTVRLDVEDDGPGVPPTELERLFEPFYRLEGSRNRETGGTGLGLPIARNILRAHGGDLTLANRPQGGLRVTFALPV